MNYHCLLTLVVVMPAGVEVVVGGADGSGGLQLVGGGVTGGGVHGGAAAAEGVEASHEAGIVLEAGFELWTEKGEREKKEENLRVESLAEDPWEKGSKKTVRLLY